MILDMSDALGCFDQSITLTRVVKYTVDFKPVEMVTNLNILAVVQPMSLEMLKKGDYDMSKKHYQIHTTNKIVIGDRFEWQGVKFQVIEVGDYNDYGYFEAVGEELK